MDQYINQIDIVDPKVIFPLILKDIEFFHHINHLKIKGNDSRELQGLIYQLNTVNAISFHDCQVTRFDFISELINNHRIESIGFDFALNEKSFMSFIQSSSFANLKYFRVSNLSQIDVSTCASYFSNLSHLSLAYCKLEIGSVLKALLTSQTNLLRELDLSGNIANEDDNYFSYSIPLKLQARYINNVNWEIKPLKYFIEVCSNSYLKSLSINHVQFIDSLKSKEKWNFLFSNLPARLNSVKTFSWNSNEMHHKFLTFLKDSQYLSTVPFKRQSYNRSNSIIIIEAFTKNPLTLLNLSSSDSDSDTSQVSSNYVDIFNLHQESEMTYNHYQFYIS